MCSQSSVLLCYIMYVRKAFCTSVNRCKICKISALSQPSAIVLAIATASKLMSTPLSIIVQYIRKEKSWQFDWIFLTMQNCYRIIMTLCGHGGTGRRVRLRGVWGTVWVQVSLAAPTDKQKCLSFFMPSETLLCCAQRTCGAELTLRVSWRYTMQINLLVALLRTQVSYKYTLARTQQG